MLLSLTFRRFLGWVTSSHIHWPLTLSPTDLWNVFFKQGDDESYCYVVGGWNVPLHLAGGHMYVYMSFPTLTYFTRMKLRKLHRQFSHTSVTQIYALLKRTRPEDLSPDTYKTLQKISANCDPCQRIQDGPGRFHVTIGVKDTRFNKNLMLDIIYFDWNPIFPIFDSFTRFSAARFLSDVSTKTVREAIIECWSSAYRTTGQDKSRSRTAIPRFSYHDRSRIRSGRRHIWHRVTQSSRHRWPISISPT